MFLANLSSKSHPMEISIFPDTLKKINNEITVVAVKIVASAAAFPLLPRITSLNIATDIVRVRIVNNITDALNSLISMIQLKIAPESTPGIIILEVILRNDFSGVSPRLIDASSTFGLIWYSIAVLERNVKASLRIARAMIMIAGVPISHKGERPIETKSVIPSTDPGIIYGNIAIESMAFVSGLLRLTAK